MIKVKTLKNVRNKLYKVVIEDQGKDHQYQVSEDLVVEYRLVRDKILESDHYQDFVKASMRDAIYQKVLHYALYKLRCSKEIHDYLNRKEVPYQQHAYYLDKLKKAKILDDKLFAETYIKEQFHFKHVGPMNIVLELKQKGISEQLYQPHIDRITDADIEAQLDYLFHKKQSSQRPMSCIKAKRDLLGYLINRGFDVEQAKAYINRHKDQIEKASQETKALDRDFTQAVKKYHTDENKRQKIIAYLMRKGYQYQAVREKMEAYSHE